jgi:hypothetical protein
VAGRLDVLMAGRFSMSSRRGGVDNGCVRRSGAAPPHISPRLELLQRCVPEVRSCSGVCSFPITSRYLVRGLPSATGSISVFGTCSSSHTDFMCPHVTVVRSVALAVPRVHRHNRVPKARMQVVARSLVSPDSRGCSSIASGLLAACDDRAVPYSWCCSFWPSLWKQPRSYSAI